MVGNSAFWMIGLPVASHCANYDCERPERKATSVYENSASSYLGVLKIGVALKLCSSILPCFIVKIHDTEDSDFGGPPKSRIWQAQPARFRSTLVSDDTLW